MATPALSPQNYFATTLSTAVGSSDTVFFLAALPTGSEGYLTIDEGLATQEILYFTSKGSNFVTLPSVLLGRGIGGTTAVGHSVGAVVKQKLNAEWWKNLQDGSALAPTSLSPVKMTNPYKFRVTRTATGTTGANAFAIIQFDTKQFDTSNNLDITTNKGRFTAPVAGYYQINAGFSVLSNANDILISIFKNGSEYSRGIRMKLATSLVGVSISDFIQLAAGDFIEINSFGSAATSFDTSAAVPYFSGFLVSTT